MRTVLLLLVFLLLPPLRTARAQDPGTPPALPSLVALPPAPVTTSEKAVDPFILPQSARIGRDRGKGALYGSAIGAVVGGVGFAAVTFIANQGGEGEDYWPLALLVGSVPGGAVGLVVGAIIRVPEGNNVQTQQARLHLFPDLSRGGTLAVSVSLPSR